MRGELRAEARRDVAAAKQFYDEQREGLGDYFAKCLLDDLKRLEAEAGIHAIAHGNGMRRKMSRRFPFVNFYRIDGSVVDVVAILDSGRDL
jgi:hypothetical protein